MLVGQIVSCWTALNGGYLGKCLEIITEKGVPWRAKVEILAVVDFPIQGFNGYNAGIRKRKPFGFKEIRDFGNSSVDLFDGEVPEYNESVLRSLLNSIESHKRSIENSKQIGSNYGILVKSLDCLNEHLE